MQALGLYYDHFRLPNGVKYYLYNANGKQVLGAYSSNENPGDGNAWANEKVQGEMVTERRNSNAVFLIVIDREPFFNNEIHINIHLKKTQNNICVITMPTLVLNNISCIKYLLQK